MISSSLERIEYTHPRTRSTVICPDLMGRTCKRRCCPRCGNPWAQSWAKKIEVDLSAYDGPVATIAITAPGATDHRRQDGKIIPGVLPWGCGREHDHGKAGCQVDDAAADAWCATLATRWPKLRDSARKRAKRQGLDPRLLVRVWEPQKRGVPHLHLVMGAHGVDHVAAKAFALALHELAPDYLFGFVDRKVTPISRRVAARYIAGYMTGRTGKKTSIRENISHPRMPLSLLWVSPTLTRITGCTMRRFRYVRWFVAWRDGRVPVAPQLRGALLVDVAHLAALIRRRLGRVGDDDEYDRNVRENVRALSGVMPRHARSLCVDYAEPERESWCLRFGPLAFATA